MALLLNGNACLRSNKSNGVAPLREFILEPGNLWDQPRPQLIANMRVSGAADALCMLRCRLQLQLRAACPVNCNRTLATPPHPGAQHQRLHRRNVAQAAKELADAYKATFLAVRDEMARDADDGKVRGTKSFACTLTLHSCTASTSGCCSI